MSTTQTADAVLDRHFLELRCQILTLAAAFDRIERSDGYQDVTGDPRLSQLAEGLKIVASKGTDRAERVQLLFSDDYQPGWNK